VSEVGVRELRNHLSRYLDKAREGEEITVTAHGRPIARLVGIETQSPLERLIAEGKVTPARIKERWVPKERIVIPGGITDLLRDPDD
jgi:prevent-host-death family protein